MRRRKKIYQEETGLDLTPMLDIVFIMLIFFIVTTSFVKESGIEVNRPNAETAERNEKGNILVAISENNEIYIDRRKVELRAIRPNIIRLRAENPEGAVITHVECMHSHDHGSLYQDITWWLRHQISHLYLWYSQCHHVYFWRV